MKVRVFVFIGLSCMATLIVIWLGTIATISAKIEEESNNMSVNVGKKIVLGKDTLTVIDYNTVMESYTLSNGTEVNKVLVENNSYGQ